jgi:hypothetical protein
VTRNDDGDPIRRHDLADSAGSFGRAGSSGQFAVGQRLTGRNPAAMVDDLPLKFGVAVKLNRYIQK